MKTSYPSFERTSYINTNRQIMDREFMKDCFAHWKQELKRKQSRCKNRIVGWAVLAYAIEIYNGITNDYTDDYGKQTGEAVSELDLLRGAHSWLQFSEGGCSLCEHDELRERLGQYYREGKELEIQARFLHCAAYRLLHALDWNQKHNKKGN